LVEEVSVAEAHLQDGQPLYKFKQGLVRKEHFRLVGRFVWQFFFQKYGGGPVIVFFIPSGCTEKQYRKGSWVKTVDSVIPAIVNIIPTSHTPKKRASINLTEPILEGQRRWAEAEAADTAAQKSQQEVIRVLELEAQQRRITAESAQLQEDVEKQQASVVLQSLFNSSQISQTIEQAKETDQQQLQTVVGDIATVFQLNSESAKARTLRDIASAERSAQQEKVDNVLNRM
jgi:hypothetical protein